MKTQLKFLSVVCLFLLSASHVEAKVLPNSQGAFGPFNINTNGNKFQKRLLTTYGQGLFVSDLNRSGSVSYCFFDNGHKNWLKFNFKPLGKKELYFSSIFVTSVELCSTKYKPKLPFKEALKTPKDITIGDSKAKVLAAYGKPQSIEHTSKYKFICGQKHSSTVCPVYGQEILSYPGAIWTLSFHLTNNRVVSMHLKPVE